MRQWVVLVTFLAVLGCGELVRAETYVAGMLGVSMPGDATNVRIQSGGTTLSGSNQALSNSALFGVKVGNYFDLQKLPWLGAELEVFSAKPSVKAQAIAVTGPGGTATARLTGSAVNVSTVGLNMLVRYPGERWQPYAGLGLGIVMASLEGDGSSTSTGLNALLGIRYKLDEKIGLFAEYKHVSTHLAFDTVSASYGASALAFGASLHF